MRFLLQSSLLSLLLCAVSLPAQAAVYKCVDAEGRVTYTNDASAARGCTRLDTSQPISSVPAPARSTPAARPAAPRSSSPGSFPRVSPQAQSQRDNLRREVLESELADEEQALKEAESALAEQEAVRLGNEQNYQKKLDRVQPYKDKVELHRRNVEALNKELGRLR